MGLWSWFCRKEKWQWIYDCGDEVQWAPGVQYHMLPALFHLLVTPFIVELEQKLFKGWGHTIKAYNTGDFLENSGGFIHGAFCSLIKKPKSHDYQLCVFMFKSWSIDWTRLCSQWPVSLVRMFRLDWNGSESCCLFIVYVRNRSGISVLSKHELIRLALIPTTVFIIISAGCQAFCP